VSVATLPPQPRADPALALLLHSLVDRCGVDAEGPRVDAAAALAAGLGGWAERLDAGATALSLGVRWTRATPAEAVGLARADLPLVTCLEGEPGGPRWVVLGERRLGRAHTTTLPDVQGARWLTPTALASRSLGGDEARTWALISPALPASPVLPRVEGGAKPSPVRRLRALLGAERRDLAAVLVYAVAVGLLTLATPIAMQVLINWLAFGALQQPIVVLSVILLGCLVLAAGLRALQRIAVEIIQRRIFVRMVADLATRLSRVRVEAFDRQYGPELVNRFFDVLTVQKAVASLMLDGLGAALQALVGLALLAAYHPVLLAYDVIVVLALAGVLFLAGRGAQRTAIKESKAKYAVASWVEELARHPLVFKMGTGRTLALERADQLARGYLETREQHWTVYLRQFSGALIVQALATVGLLALCGWLVLDGALTVGQLVAAEFIVTSALAGFTKFAGKLDTFYDLLAGIDKLGQLVDLPQERAGGLPRSSADGPAGVTLEGAAFRWPGGAGGVGPIDLDIAPGTHTAMLGRPGAGKSTIADLILGVRRPTAGGVLRDGVDLEDLRPEVAYQEAALARGVDIVHGTVEENVALGQGGAARLEVRRALKQVGLRDAIRALPEGIDTVLGPTGSPLSGSQALRLMLARALAARPRLVVIDGLLDAVPAEERRALLAPFLAPEAPWTALVLTESGDVAALLPHRIALPTGASHG
jgi:putative ABC transport system ATP-binding protein